MGKQPNSRGTIRRDLHGKACPSCGCTIYHLVLRTTGLADNSVLSARCRHCGHPRCLQTDFKHILWV